MDYFQLMRHFWDFAFENPEKIKPSHCAVYCFAVEHCNRLGWKRKFGFPASMVMDATGMKDYKAYSKTMQDLVGYGLLELIEKSRNQYSANIIALVEYTEADTKATPKALDKAFIKHTNKQSKSTVESNDSIDKQYTNIPENNIPLNQFKEKHEIFISELLESDQWIEAVCMQNKIQAVEVKTRLTAFDLKLKTEGDIKVSKKDFQSHFARWLPGEMMKSKNSKNEVIELNVNHPSRKKIG